MANIAYRILGGDFRRFSGAAMTIFESPRVQTPLSDHDPMRYSHELRIGEFHAWAGVPIVEQYVDTGGTELLVQRNGAIASGQTMPLAS